MVRAVARQKNIPYALITFVILFVIASGLAMFFYMHDDGKVARIAKLEEDKEELQSDIENLEKHLAQFAEYISGSDSFTKAQKSYDAILAHFGDHDAPAGDDEVRPQIDPNVGLVENLRVFYEQIIEQTARADGLEDRLDVQESDLRGQINKEKNRRIVMEGVVSSYKEQTSRIRVDQQNERSEHAKQLGETRQRFDEIRRDLAREINSLTDELAEERERARGLEEDNEELNIRLASLLQPALAEGKSIYPDGEITRVVDERTCYISLGSGNRVMPDMIFSVYSPSGEAKGYKAKIVIKQVFENASECVITELVDPKDPVSAGDIIANIAFDESRAYSFVVQGCFDVHGGDNPTAEGREQIIAMIRKFGGKVVDKVDVDVDFVVLGPEPIIPPEPDDETPATVREIYEARQKELQEYQAVKQQAIRLRLRILNTNRFLERIGYVPIKTLTYEESY